MNAFIYCNITIIYIHNSQSNYYYDNSVVVNCGSSGPVSKIPDFWCMKSRILYSLTTEISLRVGL